MGRVEQCVGIGIGGATLGSVAGMAGNYYARKANKLESDTFLKAMLETKKQTADRLTEADSYQVWSDAMHWTAVSVFFVTTILVVAQLARKH